MQCIAIRFQDPAGVDWGAVESFVDLKEDLKEFAQIGKDDEADRSPE